VPLRERAGHSNFAPQQSFGGAGRTAPLPGPRDGANLTFALGKHRNNKDNRPPPSGRGPMTGLAVCNETQGVVTQARSYHRERGVLRSVCLTVAVLFCGCATSVSTPIAVEYWHTGDDGLSQHLQVAVETAFRQSADFRLTHVDTSGRRLVVRNMSNLEWEPIGERIKATCTVKFLQHARRSSNWQFPISEWKVGFASISQIYGGVECP